MSQFYDLASLVVIPSGYKASTIYAQKPLTTDGQLSFTRASSATRVGPNGLIEEVRTNFLLRSNTFNTTWGASNASVTSGQSGYDGTTNAWKVTANISNNSHFIFQGFTLSGQLTLSIYAKPSGYNFIMLYAGSYGGRIFDISNGTLGSAVNTAPTLSKIEAAGNGYYRCSITVPSAGDFGVFVADSSSTYTFAGNGTNGILIQNAQVEAGDIATNYIPTTTAAVSVGPVSNVPRLDYLGSSCPRLLLEPQRTNLATFSENFDNAAWTKLSATVTANTSVSPDGYASADTLTVSAGGYLYFQVLSYSAVSGQSVTLSLFAKNQINNFLFIGGATTAGTDVYRIENYGNGWYRHILTRTFTATASTTLQYIVATVGTHIIWGAQIEAGSYATSYIPTLAASVTRVADAATKTGIGSLFGAAYTLFGEFINQGINNTRLLTVKIPSGGNYDNFITIFQSGTGLTATGNDAASAAQFSIASGSYTVGQTLKFALRCQANNVAFYINGVQIGTDNTATIPAVTALWLGNYTDVIGVSLVNKSLVFNSALTNAQLAELTTL